ncbi:MAG TPA: hypothetical protein DIC56_15580 [Rhizobium sp.]|nr:hypothetical protein [Rhizobium sp.]
MSRTMHPYQAPDMSALARMLKRELDGREDKPGHVELLNILAKAAGYRNYQHMKASDAARERMADTQPQPEIVDYRRVEAAMRCFDAEGVLLRWPARTSQQQLCLWKLWSLFPSDCDLSEPQVNDLLKRYHRFGDHVLLRRELFNQGLLFRTPDCRLYRRIERRPPPDALALIRGSHSAPPSANRA